MTMQRPRFGSEEKRYKVFSSRQGLRYACRCGEVMITLPLRFEGEGTR